MTLKGILMSIELTGSEILVQCLQAEGVKHIFGYPGGSVLYIYDALHQQSGIEHILVRHEQAAVHAADAYSRSSSNGEIGVALVTSGPGLTNAVTGIATAYYDSIPMVVISGQVPTALIGQDAFQECDAVGVTRPIVKHNFLVKDVRQLAVTIKKAFHIAKTGRPGPVLIDIPKDISNNKCKFDGYPESIEMRSYNPVVKGHSGQIKKALTMLMNAERPVIYTGGGVVLANASSELNQLVDTLGMPCVNTLMGLGGYRASSNLYLGMPGMHGNYESNMAMQHADVIISVGARFDDRVVGNVKHFSQVARKIIHIDVDPSSISKRVRADVPIVGDVKDVLSDMLTQLTEMNAISTNGRPAARIEKWWKQINEWREVDSLKYDRDSQLVKPQKVIETLHRLTGGDAFITSDVGQHQMFAAQYYPFEKPRRWINSGGLGTMGVGIPYAMGVKKLHPDADVCCITGEGSVQMCIQELSTCKEYNLPIKIFSLNNGYLGMVRQWQELIYDERYSQTYFNALPDFVKLAEAYGHVGMRIERDADVEGALKEALAMKDRLVFVDFQVDQSENVFPMVQAGKGMSEMLLRPLAEVLLSAGPHLKRGE